MRLRVYQARNIGAAMAMVRDELGPDALILANRSVDGGVELTAAYEQPVADASVTGTASEAASQIHAWPTPAAIPVTPSDLARAGTLRWHGVPSALAGRLERGDLTLGLETALSFSPLPCNGGDAPLLLAGPPGAGKTLTTARIATRLKMVNQPSLVITTDGRRAGAAEQLAAFTRLLGLTLIVADTPKQLARAVSRRVGSEPVLVDMPGLNPNDCDDRAYLRDCQAAIGATIALVLPAGLDPAETAEVAQEFKKLGATLLIATRLDQSRRLGGLLAAADAGLALTEAGIGPGVADGLTRMTPAFIADRLSYTRQKVPDEPVRHPLGISTHMSGDLPRLDR